VSSVFYRESEELLTKMFGKPVLLLQSLTLGHMSNIPILVGDNDAVILDSQVHDSVQTAVQLLKTRDIHVELVRHNRMDLLELRIKELKDSYDKVGTWETAFIQCMVDVAPEKNFTNWPISMSSFIFTLTTSTE